MATRPSLSPDGKTLVFSWRGDLWLVSSDGGRARALTRHPAREDRPVFSPDGRHVAFTSGRDGSEQVWTIPVNGGAARQLSFHSEGSMLEDWFPTGDSVLVHGKRDHFWRGSQRLLRIATGQRAAERVLFDAYARDGRVGPHGRRVLLTREGRPWWRKGYRGTASSQIWLFEPEGGGFTELLREETGVRSPIWRADGGGFYYVSAKSGSFNLWERDLNGVEGRQLTFFDDDSVVFPSISRDGSTIVFRHLFDLYRLLPRSGAPPTRIEIVHGGDHARAPTERKKWTTATDVSFTADGLEIAFIAGGDVWVMDTELREPRRVTSTPEEERDVLFASDGESLWFVSDAGGQCDIWKATRADPHVYWWRSDSFELSRVTDDPEVESRPRWSPLGDRLAFVRGLGDLWTIDASGGDARCVLESWNPPDYDWSPDGRWIVYARNDDDFNRDVWILPSDGSGEPFNLSRHPDDDYAPRWSPDGKVVAFTGRRVDREVDIYYVFLRRADEQSGSRGRKLEAALEKMKKARTGSGAQKAAADDGARAEEAKSGADDPVAGKPGDASRQASRDESIEVRIDFEGIHRRIHRVVIPGSTPRDLLFSPDSERLAFRATIDGRTGTFTVAVPDAPEPKLLSRTTGSGARWHREGDRILWLSSGLPAALSALGKATSYPFSVRTEVDRSAKYRAAFDQAWRTMRDRYYDNRLGNRNWSAVRRKYRDMAGASPDSHTFESIVNMMLGELNGSHLGFRGSHGSPDSGVSEWKGTTAHLGLRFDQRHRGPGLLVADIIRGGPADRDTSRVVAGETVLSIDGVEVDPAVDLTPMLNGPLDRDVRLAVKGADGETRHVTVRPVSFDAARSLLYESWIESRRREVDRLSGGKFGYLHVRGMNWSSFLRFERELYEVGFGKDALVIDVRDNGGGFTTDHLLTALTQPAHAITIARDGGQGYPQDRRVYASWHRPVVVLCNQNSFSNAEIFSHAIKALGRGHLVGVTTAGGVISTGGRRILDLGFLRIPMRGWYVRTDGEDMELRGAVPHHRLWPRPGEIPAGVDRQLRKAVEVLAQDVEAWKVRRAPRPRKASERPGFGPKLRDF